VEAIDSLMASAVRISQNDGGGLPSPADTTAASFFVRQALASHACKGQCLGGVQRSLPLASRPARSAAPSSALPPAPILNARAFPRAPRPMHRLRRARAGRRAAGHSRLLRSAFAARPATMGTRSRSQLYPLLRRQRRVVLRLCQWRLEQAMAWTLCREKWNLLYRCFCFRRGPKGGSSCQQRILGRWQRARRCPSA